MNIQLYGQFGDYMSIPTVSRAIANELKRRHMKFTAWGHGAIIPTYVGTPFPVAMNARANIGIYVGYPPASVGWLKGHNTKILVTVCETNKIPNEWVAACRELDYIVVPSRFCRQVFIDSGVRNVPIIIAPHGVTNRRLNTNSSFKNLFLHVSGAVSFPSRKGTIPLLQAWRGVEKTWPEAKLVLKIFPTPKLIEFIDYLKLKNVAIDDRPSLSPREMSEYLTGFDAVIQPSRGEGFGLIGLESRSLGVPVLLTSVSGHSEHFAPGVDIEVPVGPYTPMLTQGNADGFAPTVSPTGILEAMTEFYRDPSARRAETIKWAERFSTLWAWKNTLKPLMNILLPLSRKRNRTIHLGDSIGLKI